MEPLSKNSSTFLPGSMHYGCWWYNGENNVELLELTSLGIALSNVKILYTLDI